MLILSFVVTIVLIQMLCFKFTAHANSVCVFQTVNLEPEIKTRINI
jgi:hypothetical protein